MISYPDPPIMCKTYCAMAVLIGLGRPHGGGAAQHPTCSNNNSRFIMSTTKVCVFFILQYEARHSAGM